MKAISVLIVDDSETDRYLLKRKIQKLDSIDHIFEAQNGKAALELLYSKLENKVNDESVPALIFLDINMPIMGGFEFLSELDKLISKFPKIRLIHITVLSSSEREEEVQKALSYENVNNFHLKGSINSTKIESTVKAALE